jgi:hypothetical protein
MTDMQVLSAAYVVPTNGYNIRLFRLTISERRRNAQREIDGFNGESYAR